MAIEVPSSQNVQLLSRVKLVGRDVPGRSTRRVRSLPRRRTHPGCATSVPPPYRGNVLYETSGFSYRDPDPEGQTGGRSTEGLPAGTASEPLGTAAPTAAGLGSADVYGHLPEEPFPEPVLDFDGNALELPDLDAELAQLVREEQDRDRRAGEAVPAPRQPTGAHPRHRKPRPHEHRASHAPRWASPHALLNALSAGLALLIGVCVTVLGALTCYDPLHHLAERVTGPTLAELWPMLIYGPWAVATLSILRARMNQRSTVHSWLVVAFLALAAMTLCISEAPRTPSGFIIAGLPPVTVLLCCHQLVRQIDLFAPPTPPARHAHPGRGAHRHRAG